VSMLLHLPWRAGRRLQLYVVGNNTTIKISRPSRKIKAEGAEPHCCCCYGLQQARLAARTRRTAMPGVCVNCWMCFAVMYLQA
jgi:hypothetical protein